MTCLRYLLPLLFVVCHAPHWAAAADDAKATAAKSLDASETDRDKIQGAWTLKSLVRDGKKADLAEFESVKLIFDKDQYTYRDKKGDRDQGTFTVDATKNPAEMKTTRSEGAARGKSMTRIYQWVDADTINFCSPGTTEAKPDGFEAPTGSGRELSVWVREKS